MDSLDFELKEGTRDKAIFLQGITLGAFCGWIWYIIWFTIAFLTLDKTQNVMDIFSIWSIGGLAGIWLPDLAKLLIRKD